ncbi:MAG: ECF transporter S component [Oscillospiraceae bacterium]|nr:ECF transporter S component [Oscillospiraceae bacterium]
MKFTTKKLVTLALLSAIAYIVMFVTNWTPVSAAPFLVYDPKDVIIVIGGFMFGPLAVLMMSAVVSLVEMFTVSRDGFFGLAANMLSTCAFALTASFIYRIKKNLLFAVIGLAAGVACVTGVMMLWNYMVVPVYRGMPREFVAEMIVPVFMVFNLIKGGANAGFAVLLYKPVKLIFEKAKLGS